MIIGIGGASRSGKTIVAKKLAYHLKSCSILHQNDFVFPENQLPRTNGKIDWEHPHSINFNKLITEIKQEAIKNKHVIVEGFLVFYDQSLLSLLDFKIFLRIDESTFFLRKNRNKRWKLSSEYKAHIWKSYQKFGTQNNDKADVIIDTRDLNQANYIDLLNKLS